MVEILLAIALQASREPAQLAPPMQTSPTIEAAASTGPESVRASPSQRRVCEQRNRPNSRLSARVCRTPQEFEEETERSQEWFRGAQRSGTLNNPPPGGG